VVAAHERTVLSPGGAPLRVTLDATPLAGQRTGIGRYVEQLLPELALRPGLRLRAGVFSLRGRGALHDLPPGVGAVHRPVPARLLHRAWSHSDLPPASWVLGRSDVVHGTNFVLPPTGRSRGVVTVHDLSFLRFPELVDRASLDYRTLVPSAVSRAAVVLTPTRAVADELLQAYRIAPDRVRVTPLGVAGSWFTAPELDPVAGYPAEYLLAAGTLEPRKGLDVLLQAYRVLVAQQPSTPPLVLVGPTGWGPALDRSGLNPDQLLLPGYVDVGTLQALIAHALALVMPSRYEGFGLPVLEALAAGTPVVASRLPAVAEVTDGAGPQVRLVPPTDHAALTAALAARLDTPPTQQERAAGREHAAGFSWRRCAELTAAAYRAAAS
jgi:glycosyltransferase involved in cell wall biosynthesis